MTFDLILVVIITSTIQSLFGVGVLLFGTPLLLLLEYSFIDSLLILLPISATINLIQVIKDYKYINSAIYKKIVLYTIPFIVIFLYFIIQIDINISFIIGLFLILIALKERDVYIQRFINKLFSYDKPFYIIMGIIHGITNLGGALLTAKVFHTSLTKQEKRATIAISYFTFAIFQVLTILYSEHKFEIFNYLYIFIGVFIYILVNNIFFGKITEKKYNKLLSVCLIVSGIVLIIKGLLW